MGKFLQKISTINLIKMRDIYDYKFDIVPMNPRNSSWLYIFVRNKNNTANEKSDISSMHVDTKQVSTKTK